MLAMVDTGSGLRADRVDHRRRPRRDRRRPPTACASRPATSTSTTSRPAPSSASSRSAAPAPRAPTTRPARRRTCCAGPPPAPSRRRSSRRPTTATRTRGPNTRGRTDVAALTNPLRPALLAAARSPRLRARRSPNAARRNAWSNGSSPATTEPDAVAAAAAILDSGRYITIDYLGEDTTRRRRRPTATVEHYLDAAGRAGAAGSTAGHRRRRAALEVSLKLSALGQFLPARRPQDRAGQRPEDLRRGRRAAGAWVTVDAEDHTTTDSTLSIVRGTARRVPRARHGAAGLPAPHRGRLPRALRRRLADPAVQGRLQRTGVGRLPGQGTTSTTPTCAACAS